MTQSKAKPVSCYTLFLADHAATGRIAAQLAQWTPAACVIYLVGDLGAGKTTFVQAFLRALGVSERIKSPTYSLLEQYDLPTGSAWHLDLYRIADPEELLWLGLDELTQGQQRVLVEWPERGRDWLPPPDLVLELAFSDPGRHMQLTAHSDIGQRILAHLEKS